MSKKHDDVVNEKRKLEEEIERKYLTKYQSQISDLNQKLNKMTKKHDAVVAAKHKSEEGIKKRLKIKYEKRIYNMKRDSYEVSKRPKESEIGQRKR